MATVTGQLSMNFCSDPECCFEDSWIILAISENNISDESQQREWPLLGTNKFALLLSVQLSTFHITLRSSQRVFSQADVSR